MSVRYLRNARVAMAAPAVLLLVAMLASLLMSGGPGRAGVRGSAVEDGGGGGDGDGLDIGREETADGAANGRAVLEHGHGHRHRNHGGNNDNDDGSFDSYVYSMSYQPEFCRENGERFVGCREFRESWEGQLTIHGLWPNRDDGTWPSSCTDEALDPSLLEDLAEDLALRWPNVKSPLSSPGHASFWAHEWTKHGTCSGMSQHAYFARALALLLPTPSVVRDNYGSSVRRSDLEEGYGKGMVVLVCRGGYLSEVRACYEKAPGGGVGTRARCPESTRREDTCGDEIKIASFGTGVDPAAPLPRVG